MINTDNIHEQLMDNLARELGVDYIRVTHPYDAPFETRIRTSTFGFGRTEHQEKEFLCPRIDFAINGERFFGFVPVHTKSEVRGALFAESRYHVEDQPKMFDEMKKMIMDHKKSLTERRT